VQIEAEAVVRALAMRDYAAVAKRLHYPENFSPKQRHEEEEAIVQALRFLAEKFGPTKVGERLTKPPPYFEVGIFAGDLAYWSQVEKGSPTTTIVHRGTFARLGSGVIAVKFTKLFGAWRIESVQFGLLASVPNARDAIVSIGREMIEAMTPSDPRDLDREIEETIPHQP